MSGEPVERYTGHPPLSEIGYLWSRAPADLAQEIAASVMRRMLARHAIMLGAKAGRVGVDLRDALDRELTAALKQVLPRCPLDREAEEILSSLSDDDASVLRLSIEMLVESTRIKCAELADKWARDCAETAREAVLGRAEIDALQAKAEALADFSTALYNAKTAP